MGISQGTIMPIRKYISGATFGPETIQDMMTVRADTSSLEIGRSRRPVSRSRSQESY
jgi:hypothetical protein